MDSLVASSGKKIKKPTDNSQLPSTPINSKPKKIQNSFHQYFPSVPTKRRGDNWFKGKSFRRSTRSTSGKSNIKPPSTSYPIQLSSNHESAPIKNLKKFLQRSLSPIKRSNLNLSHQVFLTKTLLLPPPKFLHSLLKLAYLLHLSRSLSLPLLSHNINPQLLSNYKRECSVASTTSRMRNCGSAFAPWQCCPASKSKISSPIGRSYDYHQSQSQDAVEASQNS
jgi:hypothetical protein